MDRHASSPEVGSQQVEDTGMGRTGECLPTHLAPVRTGRHLLWDFREIAGRIWGWVRTEHHRPSLARCSHPTWGQLRQVQPWASGPGRAWHHLPQHGHCCPSSTCPLQGRRLLGHPLLSTPGPGSVNDTSTESPEDNLHF